MHYEIRQPQTLMTYSLCLFPHEQKSPNLYHGDLLAEGGVQALQVQELQTRAAPGTRMAHDILEWEEVGTCEAPWKRKEPCGCRRMAHLEVSKVPGAVVILATLPGEGGPEVNLDQLPVRAEADVTKDPEGREKDTSD